MTPTNVEYIESLFRNPLTGQWFIPILTYDVTSKHPYFSESEPLNNDPIYQDKVIENIYMRLIEKWLFKDPRYLSLLKYFRVENNDNEGKISLIDDPDKVLDISKMTKIDRMHVFKYIEKYFITKRLISKILRSYVNTTHIKWYDLFNNIDTVKDLIRHKLKRLIITTIYELQTNEK